MIELIRRVADEAPDRLAIVTHDETITYGALADLAARTAGQLVSEQIQRYAVASVEAVPVVVHLAAASLAGAEACVLPPDPPEAIADLVERFAEPVAMTDREDLPAGSLLGAVRPITMALTAETVADLPPVRPHLLLTTGTSGAPKGVRHDWSRLVRSVARVSPAQEGADQRWLLCFGLHQFAGLQVLLHTFAAGATLVAPAPRRPREGLRAMRELGVTHASATPTFWRFLMAEVRADGGAVPALRQITLGGEAVPARVLTDLERTFPDAAVSQVYAASEFGSTGSEKDRIAGLSAAVLARSEDAEVALRIVDGELWIRSRIGMVGYYGEPDVDPDAWRPTGDLVTQEGDRIVFLGRSSEIINVGGVKVHPLPIEERVGALEEVALVRVFGRANPMTGHIVALEVVLAPDADARAADAAIRASCADLPAAARPRSIRFVDEIVTAGSKIVRRDL